MLMPCASIWGAAGYCGVDVALALRPLLFFGLEVQHVLHLLKAAALVLVLPDVIPGEDRLGSNAHDIHADITGHARPFQASCSGTTRAV